jgi:PHD/YefM family antitoxin component YafN of YafNO toxin-antitoxin module
MKEQYITDALGKKIAVIVPFEEYEELMEDLHDLAVVAERKGEETTRFDVVKENVLQHDGLSN